MLHNPPETVSRRSLLNIGGKAAAALSLSSLFRPAAFAAASQRACVCVYLTGGNDSNNMIVPLDSPAYDAYARGRGSLALPASSLLAVKSPSTSANYGFHPALAGIQDLYNRGILTVVANVGRTERPLSKGQFDPRQLPSDLFKHAADSQVQYLAGGKISMGWYPEPATMPSRSIGLNDGSLSDQLGRVATELGRNRALPNYTVALGGFDTHADELNTQAKLFAELNDGLVNFYQELESLGIANRVTVFTVTEFNRTLAPNARGGADHAWGGHNLVLGGSVRGGDIYGRFPSLELGGGDDLGVNGIWIPSISNQQFSSTIARWYGMPDLSTEFPNLRNFPQQDLAFLAG